MGSTDFRSFISPSQQLAWEEPDFTTSLDQQGFNGPIEGSDSSLADEGFILPRWTDSTAISKDSNSYPISFWSSTELLEIGLSFPQSGQMSQEGIPSTSCNFRPNTQHTQAPGNVQTETSNGGCPFRANAPCLNNSLPDIEVCDAVPCISPASVTSNSATTNTQVTGPEPEVTHVYKPGLYSDKNIKLTVRQRQQRRGSHEPKDKRSKQAHSVVERRYRDSLNSKLAALHQALHASEFTTTVRERRESSNYDVLNDSAKLRKGDVLVEAMNYVHQTEVEMRHMADEIRRLNVKVMSLEMLVKSEDCLIVKQLMNMRTQQPV